MDARKEIPKSVDVSATLLAGGEVGFVGDVVHTDNPLLIVSFPRDRRPSVPVGEYVRLMLNGESLARPFHIGARIVYRRQDAKLCLYQFELLGDVHSLSFALQNRRRAPRVPSDANEPVAVAVQGERHDESMHGFVGDISILGMSFHLAQSGEGRMHDSWRVRSRFVLPGNPRELEFVGEVQYRRLADPDVIYGVEFLADATHDFEAQQAVVREYVEARQNAIARLLESRGPSLDPA